MANFIAKFDNMAPPKPERERNGMSEHQLKACPYCKGSGFTLPMVGDLKPTSDWQKCFMCGGLGVSATVEQFENAYKRH